MPLLASQIDFQAEGGSVPLSFLFFFLIIFLYFPIPLALTIKYRMKMNGLTIIVLLRNIFMFPGLSNSNKR